MRQKTQKLGEKIKTKGPLYYDIFIQKFDTELLIRGNLSASFVFTCDRCLAEFTQTIDADDVSFCKEISSAQLDITEILREELVILFPDYPYSTSNNKLALKSRF